MYVNHRIKKGDWALTRRGALILENTAVQVPYTHVCTYSVHAY